MKSLRNIFGTAAAFLLLAGFFLPWVSLGSPITGESGLALASNSIFNVVDLWLFVFPIIAILILLGLFYARLPYERVATAFGMIMLVCWAAGFAFFVLRSNAWLADFAPQMNWGEGASLLVQGIEADDGRIIRAGIGLYGTLLGLLCAGFSGIFALAGAVKPVDADLFDQQPFKPIQEVPITTAGPFPPSAPNTMIDVVSDTVPDVVDSPVAQEHTVFAWLIAVEGDSLPTGSTFTIGSARTTIGRTPQNTLVLTDKSVSGRHAEIFRQADKFTLFDLESSNGSFVYNSSLADWERISQYELKDGDRLKFGRTIFSFVHV